ncbi:AAA family ATPase [Brachybacterium sp. JHP9]|uniref:AAA family ATPase n=1 Tax=Brachybacterium equifaecis TaxID=2910770 RepID=A0ABT0R4H8_9MICO|nr:AAA family ATPase [Brachybacterium equifaecis]MCL6424383.1 AAA family ATPase [Brachybacterium equifaecis]
MADDTDEARIFDASSLGLVTPTGDMRFTQMVGDVPASQQGSPQLVPGSVAAAALHSVFEGRPVTIVNSPPGAGKSSLVAELVNWLLKNSELTVHIVAPTNNACLELAAKIVSVAGPATAKVKDMDRVVPPGVITEKDDFLVGPDGRIIQPERFVEVTTVHSAKHSQPLVDVMISEESYQTTYANLLEAADATQQLILVGDPGQIGPVIQHDVAPWRGIEDAPAARAPEVFARMDARILTLPCTFRIGQESAAAIAPLYPFPFHSERPPKRIEGLAEIEALEIGADLTAPQQAEILARRAASIVGATLHETQRDGQVIVRPIQQSDVCIVAARNEIVARVSALLGSAGFGRIVVGTADSLQGGQWHAVIAIDPLSSLKQVSAHALDNGRLCVMTSRHMSHLTWVYAPGWEQRITESKMSPAEADKGLRVRRTLTSKPKAGPR